MLPLRFRTRRHAGVPELSEKRREISRICPRTTPASSVWFRIAHDALYDGSANRTQTKADHIDNLPPAVSQPPERNHDSKSATQLQVRSCDLLLLRDNQRTFLWQSSVNEKKKKFYRKTTRTGRKVNDKRYAHKCLIAGRVSHTDICIFRLTCSKKKFLRLPLHCSC